MYQAGDFLQFCRVGHSFFVHEGCPRCRSPPIKIGFMFLDDEFRLEENMNNEMRNYVINLLETCPERQRQIALLHYELEHPARLSDTEIIGAMALGHGERGNHVKGHVSDKTVYIALNYQNRADKINANVKTEIVVQLVALEEEQKRLEYYMSLLGERQVAVLQLIYFKRLPFEEIASQIGVVLRTVRKIKDRAIDELTEMYKFTDKLN